MQVLLFCWCFRVVEKCVIVCAMFVCVCDCISVFYNNVLNGVYWCCRCFWCNLCCSLFFPSTNVCVVDCCLCSGLLVFVFGLVVCGFLVIDMYTHVCLFLFFLSVFDMLCLICVLLFVCFWRVCV